MINTDDVQLQIKKHARRRLVGAAAFVALAALILPMVMDQEPAPPAQEVEVRIPGRDASPFRPDLIAALPPGDAPVPPSPPETVPAPAVQTTPPQVVAQAPAAAPVATPAPAAQAPQVQPPAQRPQPTPPTPAPPPPVKKPDPAPSPTKDDEAKRAAAILSGKMPDTPSTKEAAPAKDGQHVVLIGAFTNEGNVKNLKNKLGELNIPVYTEPLDSPQGRKTRVRAGPFPNRGAAEKALEKMKRIGVSGVVVAR